MSDLPLGFSDVPPDHDVRETVRTHRAGHQFLGAGAGSGKTSTLVARYLTLLAEEELRPRQIVAVTFTDKAAAELKQRVREACRKRAKEARQLAREAEGLMRQARLEQADAWEDRAAELETAPVSTIHGLCGSILRENALAAGLDPAFSVLDETESALLLEQTVQQSLLSRLDDPAIESAPRLLTSLGLGTAVAAVVFLIARRAETAALLDDPAYADPAALLARWEQQLAWALSTGLRALIESEPWRDARTVLDIYESSDPDDKLEVLRRTKLALIKQVDITLDSPLDCIPLLRELRGGRTNVGSAKAWDPEALEAVRKAVGAFTAATSACGGPIEELLQIAGADPELTKDSAVLTCALVTEFRAALADYDAARLERGALDFEDLLLRVRDLWRARPEALARWQARVREVMVDEFQDTNQLQKDVLWPLTGGGARLFVVGDAKQSIYRFRGADVTVFNHTRTEVGADGCCHELTASFRSSPALVAAFNRLFGDPALMGPPAPGRPAWEADYADLEPVRLPCPDGAPASSPLELCLLQADPAAAPAEPAADEDADDLPGRELEARWIARRIRALLEDGRLVGDREAGCWRPVQPRDIALLFHALTDVALYESALRDQGIPTYLVAGRGFYGAQEVRDVVNALRAIENPLDEVALVGALRSPLFAVSDEALFWLSRLQRATWWERLLLAGGVQELSGVDLAPLDHLAGDDHLRLRHAARVLGNLRERKNRLPLSGLIEALIGETGFSAALAAQYQGARMVANLRKLTDLAGEFEREEVASGAGLGLRDLLEHLGRMEVREVREPEAPTEEEIGQAVRLMTVHGAKGLEWPVVFVVDLARQRRGESDPVRWHPALGLVAREGSADKAPWPAAGVIINRRNTLEDEAEERRKLYVAATRARDLLVLSASYKLRKASDKTPDRWPSVAANGRLGWFDTACVGRVRELAGEDAEVELLWDGEGFVRREETAAPRLEPLPLADAGPAGTPAPPRLELVTPVPPQAAARDRFTATELATYLHCPRRYWLEHVLGLPPDEPAFLTPETPGELSAVELGELVHHVLRVTGSDGPEGVELALAMTDGAPRLDTRLDLRAAGELEAIRRRALHLVDSDLYRERIATARRLRSEMLLAFALPGSHPPALIEGRVDALAEDAAGGLHLLDYKVSRPAPDQEASYRLQLGLYALGIRLANGTAPATASIVYLAPEGLHVHELDLPAAMDEATARALEAIAGLRAADWPRTHDRCPACPHAWRCG